MGIQEDGRDYILQAMVSMAAADGDVHESEVAAIRSIYAHTTGREISDIDLGRAPVARRGLTGDLARDRKTLARNVREDILRAAYRILLADGQIAAGERKILEDIAEALEIPEIHKNVILEEIEEGSNPARKIHRRSA